MFGGQSRSSFQSDGGLSRLRFDRQRDFGVRGQFFCQFFGLLLRAFKVFGGGFDGDGFDLFGGAFGLQRRGFGMFWNFGRQNVRPFIGRDLFNGGGRCSVSASVLRSCCRAGGTD